MFREENLKLGCFVGRCNFVFLDRCLEAVADDFPPGLDCLKAAQVYAHRGVEAQRPPAGGRFGIAEQYADFGPQLVGEYQQRVVFLQRAG